MASTLGLPVPYLVDLFTAGMLPELAQLLSDVLPSPTPLWTEPLPARLLDACSSAVTANSVPVWTTLFATSHMNGIRWAETLASVCASRFKPSLGGDGFGLLQKLRFVPPDLNCAPLLKPVMPSPCDSVPLTQPEKAVMLGKSLCVVRELTARGMLDRQASTTDLNEFRNKWMFTSEVVDVAKLVGRADGRSVRTVLGASNVERVSMGAVALWPRSAIYDFLSL